MGGYCGGRPLLGRCRGIASKASASVARCAVLRCGCHVAVSVRFAAASRDTAGADRTPQASRSAAMCVVGACLLLSSSEAVLRGLHAACMGRVCLLFPGGLVCVCVRMCVVSLLCRPAAPPGFACTTYTCKWLQAPIQQGADSADSLQSALLLGAHCPLHRASVLQLHCERARQERSRACVGGGSCSGGHMAGCGAGRGRLTGAVGAGGGVEEPARL